MVEYRTFWENQINLPDLMKKINTDLLLCEDIIDDEHMDCIEMMIPEIIEITKWHRSSLPVIIIAVYIHGKYELQNLRSVVDKFDTTAYKIDIIQASYRLLMRFKHFGYAEKVINYECGASLLICD